MRQNVHRFVMANTRTRCQPSLTVWVRSECVRCPLQWSQIGAPSWFLGTLFWPMKRRSVPFRKRFGNCQLLAHFCFVVLVSILVLIRKYCAWTFFWVVHMNLAMILVGCVFGHVTAHFLLHIVLYNKPTCTWHLQHQEHNTSIEHHHCKYCLIRATAYRSFLRS